MSDPASHTKPSMSFAAIDVETANEDRSTICQNGTLRVENGKLADQWKTLMDPEDEFNPWFVEQIHGISETDVVGSPTLPELYGEFRHRLGETVVVNQMALDCVSISRALERYELDPLDVTWLDGARVARRGWPE